MSRKKVNERLKNVRSLTVLLFVLTAVIWVALLFMKMFLFQLSFSDLLDDVISNILGILPPILIFNFVYEYFTQKFVADEISEKVAETIMGHSEIMAGFKDEQKIEFIKSTVNTMVSPDTAEMTNAVIYPYISNTYNIRTYYKYSITLRHYDEAGLFPGDRYIKVYEDLKFRKKYIHGENLPQSLHIGFIAANHELDLALRNQSYLFQENLCIDQKEMALLLNLEKEEQLKFITQEMRLTLYVDNCKAEVQNVSITPFGFDIECYSPHSNTLPKDKSENSRSFGKYDHKTEHTVEISFAMPQLKGHSEFLVSINEPTYSPLIQFSYPENSMKVNAYSFLNDGDESSVEKATHNIGTYEFCIQNKWIYPVGGVVFVIDDL